MVSATYHYKVSVSQSKRLCVIYRGLKNMRAVLCVLALTVESYPVSRVCFTVQATVKGGGGLIKYNF